MLFVPRRTGVIGRKETRRSKTIMQLPKVGASRQDVVPRLEGIEPEPVANAEFDPGRWHELYEADCATRRDRTLVSAALNLHHSANPSRRHGKPGCGIRNQFGEPVDRLCTRGKLRIRTRFGLREDGSLA